MRNRLATFAIVAVAASACGEPATRYAFESGSPEDLSARYIAEWGGEARTYRAIFRTDGCISLELGLAWDPANPPGLETRAGREQYGYMEARKERMEQLGC